MKTRTLHRALSMLLTAAMVMNIGLTPVFAEGVTTPGVSGVCTHHTEHTEDCGYRQGTPCNHEHTEDCYTKKLTCPITTGDTAGDAPEVATDSDADIDSDAVVDSDMDIDSDAVVDSGNGSAGAPHTHGEDCFTKTDNCTHIHDETCGYTPDSPCSFDPASCTQCDTGDKQPEQDCPCPPVDSGEPVHGENCPLYTAPPLSEAVQALIAMVDALPNPEDITEDNKDTTLPDFEAAAEAYGALSEDDKAAFDETPQHTKLMALRNVLLGLNTLEITTHRVASEEDLTKAINDANTGDTIQLAADFGFANNIIFPADKALVLDLNSKTLVANPPDGDNIIITIETGAELTITDSGSGGTLMREDIGEVEFIVNSGILNINSGTILVSSTTGSQLGVIINKGTFNFTGGNFLFNASGSKYIVDNNGGDVTIDGVTLEITDRVYVVRNFEGGNVNIENSTIRVGNPSIAENLSALVNSNGTATITDSTISASGAKAQAITNGSNGTAKIIRCNITNPGSIGTSTIGNNGNLEITGGKLSYIPLASDGADGVIQNNKDLTIHSGVFTSTGVVINNIGGTSVTINDGTFVSTSQKYPALEVGGTYTVNNGIIISVNNGRGDVVELLNKVHGTTTLTENVNIPAGKTLTVPAGASLTIDSNVTLSNGGTLDNLGTVTNNGTVRNRGTVKTAGSDGNGIWNGAEPVAADANVTVGSDFGADYASIYDAWSEAGNTAVITLISDVSFLYSMGMAATAHKNITLDLNGYTLEYTGTGAGIYVDQGNTLTFKNGVYIVHNYSGYLSNAFSYRDSVTSITLENCLILGDGRDDAAADAWKVHGTATLYNNYTLAAGKTLTVPADTTLTIPTGVTLTNNGTITVLGTIVNEGTIANSGSITGTGSLSGSGMIQVPLQDSMVSLPQNSYPYTGSAITPTVSVANVSVLNETLTFAKDTDYTVGYSPNTEVGSVTVTVTPKAGGQLSGAAVTKTFTITQKAITPTIEAIAPVTYTGTALTPPLTVKDGSTALKSSDYTAIYSENINVGENTGKVAVTLKGNYNGSANATFTITPKVITPTIEAIAPVTYTGTALTPPLTVKDGSTVLAASDYTAIYSDNIDAGVGTGKVAVTLKGNYNGSANATFTIAKAIGPTITAEITGAFADAGGGAQYTYTVTPITGAEYKMDSGGTWQASNIFTGILPLSKHTFYARIKETANYQAGAEKAGNEVTAPRGNVPVELNVNDGNINISAAGYTVNGGSLTPHTVGYVLTGTTNATGDKYIPVTISGGTHNITLKNASITSSGAQAVAFTIGGGSTVNLTLEGTNALKSGNGSAGLQVAQGCTLNIMGSGSLNAEGNAAGIGGGSSTPVGTINIKGGNITASSTSTGAGIGGGYQSTGGTINISGGTVRATGNQYGAGIGGGSGGTTGSKITISGGTVNATGGRSGAGIGSGNSGVSGTILISGGAVTATGGSNGAGIGGGNTSGGGTITISGGTVTATGDAGGAGIGSGLGDNTGTSNPGGDITISDNAVVFATMGSTGTNHIGAGTGYTGTAGSVSKNGGVVFEGTAGSLYAASVTPTDSFTIPAAHTLTIDSGKTLTMNSSTTLTNNGTLVMDGTVVGTGSYTGSGTVNLVKSMVKPPESLGYTGTAKAISVKLLNYAFTQGSDYTVAYSPSSDLVNPGAAITPTVTPKSGGRLTGSAVQGDPFTITGSATEFTGGIKTLKGSTAQTTFAYGDMITVKVTPTATGSKSRMAAPGANQVALFLGGTQLTEAQNVTSGVDVTFTLDTKAKALQIGANEITAQYVGNGNMAGHSESVTVTLNQKPLTATISAGGSKPYDGTVSFTGAVLTIGNSQILSGDTVSASATIEADTASVGSKTPVVKNLALTGASKDWYSLAANGVTGSLTITAATPSVDVVAEKKEPSFFRSIIGSHEDTITLTATVTGVNGEKPNGTVVFKNGGTTLATKSVSNGVATHDWANPPASDSITITAEFTASDSNYISTAVTDTYEFGISKVDQKDFAITAVGNKTYGDPAFVLSTTGGSSTGAVSYTSSDTTVLTISGSTATIVKEGTVTITATKAADSNYNAASGNITIKIAKATPTVSWGANTTQTVTYTGAAAVITPPTVTLVNSESYTGTITYQHKSTATKLTNLFGLLEGYTAGLPADAGEYKIIATVAADGNYAVADSAEMTLTISKITSTLTIDVMAGKTYDGTAIADPTNITSNITNPTVTYTYYKDDGSGAKGVKLSGAPKDAGNYWVEGSIAETGNTTAVTSNAVSFTIAKAPLTITGGTVTQREYDSTTAATVTALTFDGLKNGETLSITTDYKVGTPLYDSADAGANKTVSGTAVLESNAKTSNYTLTGAYSITNQTISKKTGIAAPSYTAMDNTGTTKSFTFGTVSGYTDVTAYEWKLDTDADTAWASVTVNPITFGNRAGKMQVRVKGTTNYEAGAILTHSTAFTATLEGSVSIDGTATYGETLTAKPTGTQTGAVLSYEWKSGTTVLQAKSTNDTYKIAGTAVGDTITVEVTATSYTGSLTASTTAVAKRNLTVTAAAQNKEYDGGTAASVRFTFGSGEVISGDTVTATATGTFANKNVGDDKTVSITGFALGGAAKDYYTVTTPPTTATANITAKALTVGDGTLVITKAYDTTTTFTTSTGSLGLTGVVGGETVGVKIDSYGAAADANVGTKTLSLGISLDGADKDNYTVTSPYSFTKASITAKAIIPTIESIAAVTYDGTAKEPALTVKDGNTVLAASDYTAIYSDNTNAGENTGKVAVTLKGNYDGSANATFTIHKAAGLTATTPNNILMIKGQEKPYTFNLSTIALSKTDAGAKTYTLGALTDSNSIFKVAPSINGAEMTFTSNSIATPATNQATQVVTISTQNYADTTVTISFDITDKTPVTITGLTAATNLVYNGSAQNGYTGTAQFSPDWSGTLTYTYYVGTGISGTKLSGAPKNAGTYTVVASIPDSDTSMAGSHAPITFTIGAKEITVAKGSYKVSKTYDGTTSAGTSSGTLSVTGILPTDGGVTVVPGAISAYSDSAVKSNYDIALPITISGDTNSNYKLVASTVTVPGEITKASVTATIDPIAAQTYTGSQQRPAVTVKVGGNTIADSNYTVEYGANVNAGTGSVTVKAKATGNYTFGDVTANFTINKAAGPAISGAVTGSYTGNGTTFTYTIVSISGAEYKMDSGAWQDSNVFAGIAPMSKHTFSARMKETANYEAGTEKAGNEVNFAKLSGVAAPALAYTVSGTTGSKTIAITTVTGAEYQFGSDAWSDTNTKTYSTDETVTIGIRMKTTPTHEAGTAATASVNLAKQEQTAPAAFTLTYAANGETNYTVTIPEVAGCEYSFDGATYNSTRTKTASVGDTVTGYMRKAETTTHNASPAVSASVTLPMFKVQPITASPSDRNFSGSTSVSLASDTAGAEIYYTTNGSTPSIASTKYTAAFTLTETTTVKAIAIKTGMTDSDVASFTFTKNSGGGGTGGGGGGVTPAPDPKPETPTTPTTAESNVNSKTDKDGNATAAVEEKDITNAIDKAQKEAKKNGTEANGIAITLNVKTDKNASTLGVTLPQKSVSALIAANVTSVTVKNGLSTVTLDLATLKALAGGDVILSISKADPTKLSTEAKAAIGNRPVFQFSLTSGGKPVSDFKGGRAGLQIPYTLTTTEQAGNLCGVYVDANGKVNWLEASSYDPITGMMLISAQHFSTYGIGYKQSTPKFTDVGTHWARNDIDFVVARGLLTGTSNTTFAPETSMTRGMFVTSLGRLAGVDTKKYSNTKFTDVAATAYYSPYVAWASANNIVTGTSDTTFSPDKAITRQEMAVMLVNYSKAIGYKLPSVHAEVSFVDSGSIASWAKDAVKQMQMAGILMGKSGNRFDPTATATRAEVSAMLRRFVELVVNTETAEGWAMNESGQWMYIQDGKRVTGSKTIGGKSYTFDQLGVTTALPPERKYLTYTVQAGDSFWAIALKYKVSIYELAKVNNKSIFSIIHPGDELKIPQQ